MASWHVIKAAADRASECRWKYKSEMCKFAGTPGGCDYERKLSKGYSAAGGVGWGEVGWSGLVASTYFMA
jgi:hypothetical protein